MGNVAPWAWKRAREETQRVAFGGAVTWLQKQAQGLGVSVFEKRKVAQSQVDSTMRRLYVSAQAHDQLFDVYQYRSTSSHRVVNKNILSVLTFRHWLPLRYEVSSASMNKRFQTEDLVANTAGLMVTRTRLEQWSTLLPLRMSGHALARMYDRQLGGDHPMDAINFHARSLLGLALLGCAWKAKGSCRGGMMLVPMGGDVLILNFMHDTDSWPVSIQHDIQYHHRDRSMYHSLNELSDPFGKNIYARVATAFCERILTHNKVTLRDRMQDFYNRHQVKLDTLIQYVSTPWMITNGTLDLNDLFDELTLMESSKEWQHAMSLRDIHDEETPVEEIVRLTSSAPPPPNLWNTTTNSRLTLPDVFV